STDSPVPWFSSATATAGAASPKLATNQKVWGLFIYPLLRRILGKALPAFSSPYRHPGRGSRKKATGACILTRQPLLPTFARMFRRLKLSLWLSRKFYFPRTHSHLQLLLRPGS